METQLSGSGHTVYGSEQNSPVYYIETPVFTANFNMAQLLKLIMERRQYL
ncbi:MAG: hypothetical protein WAN36_12370 [Calditrichia bacterium]